MLMNVRRWDVDRVGSVLGSACAVHCALSGLALASISFLGAGFWMNERLEYAFIGTTLCVGTFAARRGFLRHRSWRPALLFVTALSLIVSAHLIGREGQVIFLRIVTSMMAVGGALTLVIFHRVNQCLCRNCERAK
ncbi:MAG: hypothetical protein C4320_08850 [Armatimonadota bacterium]